MFIYIIKNIQNIFVVLPQNKLKIENGYSYITTR